MKFKFNFPVLGKRKTDLSGLGLINESTPFAIREAYKSLYTNIVYLHSDSPTKKIVITSAIPSEGKSTVSANLALTVAQNSKNKKVLIIDADMRVPRLAHIFSIKHKTSGLSEFLAGVDETPNFIELSEYNLTILTAGGKAVNPTQLISSSALGDLFKICEERFDYIIIDTPPVNVVTDALLLSSHVNGYVISTLTDYSDVKNVGECIDKFNQVDAEIYGFVLSGIKLKNFGNGRYSKYSKYSSEDNAI